MHQHLLLPSSRRTILTPDRRYRYVLWRAWGPPEGPYVLFVGLNPSTADETLDDPTIRRCLGFARAWGFEALCMANLFAFRATDPKDMRAAPDPVGPDNDQWLLTLSQGAQLTIAAWGTLGTHLDRANAVLPLLKDPHGLGQTQAGQPRHPLYLAAGTRPSPFVPR